MTVKRCGVDVWGAHASCVLFAASCRELQSHVLAASQADGTCHSHRRPPPDPACGILGVRQGLPLWGVLCRAGYDVAGAEEWAPLSPVRGSNLTRGSQSGASRTHSIATSSPGAGNSSVAVDLARPLKPRAGLMETICVASGHPMLSLLQRSDAQCHGAEQS
jgi:hypothetical protein